MEENNQRISNKKKETLEITSGPEKDTQLKTAGNEEGTCIKIRE